MEGSLLKTGDFRPQGKESLGDEDEDAASVGKRNNQHGEPCRSLEGSDRLGMCQQR
jgi:hypothetical protein